MFNRPHSSAGRIDLSISGIKRSISKDYYSPIRMQRSTIDIPYSQTTQSLLSPSINRRLVGFTNTGHSSRISSINKTVLPIIHHHDHHPHPHHNNLVYNSSHGNNNNSNKWNSMDHQSLELLNQTSMNRNSYARQTLTQNIQEMTQKQRLLLSSSSSNQQYYPISSHNNKLGK